MHHLIVTRIAWGIAWTCALAALVFAALEYEIAPAAPARLPHADDPGAPLYRRYCGDCHEWDDIARRIGTGPAAAERAAEMRDFLRRHGDASAADDGLIVGWLARAADR